MNVVEQLRERLNCNAVPIQMTIGAEDGFVGVVTWQNRSIL